MTKIKIIFAILLFIMTVVIMIYSGILAQELDEKDQKEFQDCVDRNEICPIKNFLDLKELKECNNNCIELSLKYYKYDSGGLGQRECWCKNDSTLPVQIY